MLNIRPVSDLRNKYPEVEKQLNETKKPIILTKNCIGVAALLSIDEYEHYQAVEEYNRINSRSIEETLLEGSINATTDSKRYTLEEVFDEADKIIKDAKKRIQNKSNKRFQK